MLKKINLLAICFAILVCLNYSANAQTGKYDANKNLIAIEGLLSEEDSEGCDESKIFLGKITNVKRIGNDALDVTVKMSNTKHQIVFDIVAGKLGTAMKSWLVVGKTTKIKARHCGNGGIWTPETIWKQ